MHEEPFNLLGVSPDDWAKTPESVQLALLSLLDIVRSQSARLREHETLLRELQAKLGQSSRNSSKPPSSDPPSAPPRPPRVPRGRQAGGQSGHPRHERPTPDPDHIDAVRDHFPSQCPSCQTDLADRQQDACAVQIQFEWELPEVRPFNQYHTVCRTGCGGLVTAERHYWSLLDQMMQLGLAGATATPG